MPIVNYPINIKPLAGEPDKPVYEHPDMMHPVERHIDANGILSWKSYETPEDYHVYARVDLPINLPGVVIFVHGVNSEGEWYDVAEQALCEGLNERLNRDDLKPNKYVTRNKDDQPIRRTLKLDNDGRSPVIRFYWGYRAQDGQKGKWRIPLKNPDQLDCAKHGDDKNAEDPWYWGGGPFQNGTNNLQQLWSPLGFSREVLGFDMQQFNTEVERELNDAPPRQYFAHAAGRLAKLIDTIREQSLNSLTIVSHSQGTMLAMAATLLCKKRPPDAVMLMNSPYALTDKFTDALTCGHERPTDGARLRTLQAVVDKLRPNQQLLNDQKRLDNVRIGATKCGQMHYWRPNIVHPCGTSERDNHGRLYNYFNPHDRVMGAEPLQSIGWQGIPGGVLIGMQDVVKQRMLARGTPCGDEPALTPFGKLPLIPDPEPGVHPTNFWNGNRKVLLTKNLWAVPPLEQMASVNAERVPKPLTAEEMSAPRIKEVTRIVNGKSIMEEMEVYFDESVRTANAWGAMGLDGKFKEPDFPYLSSFYQDKKIVSHKDIYSASGEVREPETQEELQQRITNYYPMPANHSTLSMHVEFIKRVVAYDLPVGFCGSYTQEKWAKLIYMADWTNFTDSYFDTGNLTVPAMPPEIDRETVSDQIRKADEERIKNYKTYGGA
ncbi:hypothetical protein [Herbaspirillum sp. RV1423]|uniref:T6SS effector phospholipase Tle3 domain-containing protein n=1 Tax=Herbaspirillum sp. RV1423 TaxID=1443993 RepID=UPI0004B8814E|nr:hypothetical protein [Herbaspirillum sp. RV1423]